MDLHAFYSFYVDTTPIRVFKNNKDIGVAYPDSQPVGIYSTIWNGENWATNDGWVKLNWTMAPFVATYEGFNVDACLAQNGNTAPCIAETNSWWEQSAYQTLGVKEVNQLAWIRKNYLLYDYCADRKRFPTAAPECARNPLWTTNMEMRVIISPFSLIGGPTFKEGIFLSFEWFFGYLQRIGDPCSSTCVDWDTGRKESVILIISCSSGEDHVWFADRFWIDWCMRIVWVWLLVWSYGPNWSNHHWLIPPQGPWLSMLARDSIY